MSLSVDLQFSLLQFVGHAEKAFPWCNARVCGAIGVVTSLPQIDDYKFEVKVARLDFLGLIPPQFER